MRSNVKRMKTGCTQDHIGRRQCCNGDYGMKAATYAKPSYNGRVIPQFSEQKLVALPNHGAHLGPSHHTYVPLYFMGPLGPDRPAARRAWS